MALVECPECGTKVENSICTTCPECGYPLNEDNPSNIELIVEEDSHDSNKIICPECGFAVNEEDVEVCPECGYPIGKFAKETIEPSTFGEEQSGITWTCPQCGREVKGSQFCYYCGHQLGEEFESEIDDDSDESESYESFLDYCFHKFFDFKGEIQDRFAMPDIEMTNPDTVNNIERSQVINVLENVRKITVLKENTTGGMIGIDNQVELQMNKAQEILDYIPWWGVLLKTGLVIIGAIPILVDVSLGTVVIAAIWGWLSIKYVGNFIIGLICRKENEKNTKAYLSEVLPGLAKQYETLRKRLVTIITSSEWDWAKEIVGEEMLHKDAVDMLIGYIKSRRADNIKEALNKFDTDCHQQRMEYMQQEIDDAAQVQANEAIKQTEYAASTAKSAKAAAVASQITAYNTWRIKKNTKKIYRNMRN